MTLRTLETIAYSYTYFYEVTKYPFELYSLMRPTF